MTLRSARREAQSVSAHSARRWRTNAADGGAASRRPVLIRAAADAAQALMPARFRARSRARSTTATCSGCSSCCPRRRCCWCSSPIRSASAPGSASPTPRSAAPANGSGSTTSSFLWGDAVTRLALFNTLFYTTVASVIKFALGLWLALLLNKHLPFKSFFRAIVLLPFIVPDGAVRDRVLVDLRLPVLDHQLGAGEDGPHPRSYIDFLGDPWNAALLDDRRQHLARRPVRGDHAARRAADDLAVATTRRPASTAPRPGSSSAT